MSDFVSQQKKVRNFKQGVNDTLGKFELHSVGFKDHLRNIVSCSVPDDDERLREELQNILPLLSDLKKVTTEMENLILDSKNKIADKLIVNLRPKAVASGGRKRMPPENDLSQDSAVFSADSQMLLPEAEAAIVHPSDERSITSSGFAGEPTENQFNSSSSDEDYNANQ